MVLFKSIKLILSSHYCNIPTVNHMQTLMHLYMYKNVFTYQFKEFFSLYTNGVVLVKGGNLSDCFYYILGPLYYGVLTGMRVQ